MCPLRPGYICVLALGLISVTAAGAQQQQPAALKTPPSDEHVTEKGFRSRVFEVKHRNSREMMRVLAPLGSGFKGATMSFNEEFKTITVRDFPENIATIEEAIKRLDVPEPARPDIEFRVHILVASNQQPAGNTGGTPAELEEVLKQLKTTLNYRHYHLMTSQVLRGKEGPGGLGNKGVAELRLSPETAASQHPIFYDYRIDQLSLDGPATPGGWKVQIGRFGFGMRIPLHVGGATNLQYENVGFSTPVGLREGEKVVVGTTSMQDKGIVIVIVANVIK